MLTTEPRSVATSYDPRTRFAKKHLIMAALICGRTRSNHGELVVAPRGASHAVVTLQPPRAVDVASPRPRRKGCVFLLLSL
jgi:hypothetical protein